MQSIPSTCTKPNIQADPNRWSPNHHNVCATLPWLEHNDVPKVETDIKSLNHSLCSALTSLQYPLASEAIIHSLDMAMKHTSRGTGRGWGGPRDPLRSQKKSAMASAMRTCSIFILRVNKHQCTVDEMKMLEMKLASNKGEHYKIHVHEKNLEPAFSSEYTTSCSKFHTKAILWHTGKGKIFVLKFIESRLNKPRTQEDKRHGYGPNHFSFDNIGHGPPLMSLYEDNYLFQIKNRLRLSHFDRETEYQPPCGYELKARWKSPPTWFAYKGAVEDIESLTHVCW